MAPWQLRVGLEPDDLDAAFGRHFAHGAGLLLVDAEDPKIGRYRQWRGRWPIDDLLKMVMWLVCYSYVECFFLWGSCSAYGLKLPDHLPNQRFCFFFCGFSSFQYSNMVLYCCYNMFRLVYHWVETSWSIQKMSIFPHLPHWRSWDAQPSREILKASYCSPVGCSVRSLADRLLSSSSILSAISTSQSRISWDL